MNTPKRRPTAAEGGGNRPLTTMTRGVAVGGLVLVAALLPQLQRATWTDPVVLGTVVGGLPFVTVLVPRFERYWTNLGGCLYAVAWVTLLVAATGGHRSPFVFLYVVVVVMTGVERTTRQLAVTVAASFAACLLPILYQTVPSEYLIGVLLQGSFFTALAIGAHVLVTRLRASETSFRLLAENATDVVFRYRLQEPRGYGYISPAIERITGYTPQEMYADPDLITRLFSPEDLERHRPLWTDPADRDEFIVQWTRKDGSRVWIEQRFVVIRDDDGAPVAFEGIIRDVTTRKELEESLRAAVEREQTSADRLREADEVKNAFLQAVSHDLRTPLTSLLGYANTIRDRLDALPDEHVRTMADRMAVNADKMRRILTDLLDVDRLSSGAVEAVRSRTELGTLVRRVVAELELGDRPVDLDLERVVVAVDAPQIERVVENLLLNAAKHTPADTPLWVRVSQDDGQVDIVVEDAGPGVPDALKDQVFEVFQRGDHNDDGTGVGLALVARLVALHGGQVWVDDRPGGGARFHVRLPLAEEQAPASPDAQEHAPVA